MHPATPLGSALPRGARKSRLWRAVAAAAMVLPLALTACATSTGNSTPEAAKVEELPTGPVEINVFFWGGDRRAELTKQVFDLYMKKHTNVTIKQTWQANQGYVDKLNTLIAGGSAPDIFQLDDNMLGDYAGRSLTLNVDDYVAANRLNFKDLPQSLVDYGKLDGKQLAVPLAENTPAIIYNKKLIADLGVAEPQIGWTWDQYVAWGKEINTKSQGKVKGIMDPSADYKALWIWLRQQGKDFYADKKLGFTEEDLTKWFEYWKAARDGGATPPADVLHGANGGSVSEQLVVKGSAAISWVWSNQLPELAKATKDPLGIVAYPGDPSAQWARAALYFAGYANTKYKATVVDIMNFFINDPEAGKILGTERGLPANLTVRSAVQAGLTDQNMKATFDFQNAMASKFGKAPAVPPKGQSQIRQLLITTAEKAQYGELSPADAAKEFFSQAPSKIG